MLIGGEAGIGKTALVETLCNEATDRGMLVLVGRCYDLAETPPYGPWMELFEHYPAGDTLPPLPGAFARRGSLGSVESQAALFDAVQGCLAALAAHYPLVLVLEDLHWADTASLDLIRSLARGLRTLPLILLATYRADELTRRDPLYIALPALVREVGADRVGLSGLSDDALLALIARRYRLGRADETRLVTYLRRRAEGNALFTTELLRTLEERGALAMDGGTWRLGDLAGMAVPSLLRQVIDARVLRLGEEAHRLLTIAAVVGQEIPLGLWAALVDADEDTLLAVIERASAARVVEVTGDGLEVRFMHALIREALYEGHLAPRRRAVHRQAVEALLAAPLPDPDEMVYHLRAAGDPRLADWLIRAGTRAMEASAEVTARARYEETLPLLTAPEDAPTRFHVLMWLMTLARFERVSVGYGEEAARIGRDLGDEMWEAVALLRVGHVRCINEDIPRGLAEMERAVRMLNAFPDMDRLRSYVPYTPLVADRGRGSLALNLACVGRLAEAQALITEEPLSGNGLFARMVCETALGRPAAVRSLIRKFLDRIRAGDYRTRGNVWNLEVGSVLIPYLADDTEEVQRVAAAAEGAWAQAGEEVVGFPARMPWLPVFIVQGRWEEAWTLLSSGRRFSNTSHSDALYSPLRGMLARAQGKTVLAREFVHEMFPDGPATAPGAIPIRQALALQETAALLALDDDDAQAALRWIEAHDHWLAWSGVVPGRSEGQALWAMYYRHRGDAVKAKEHAGRALVHATEPRQPLALLAAHRLLGELATDAGRDDDARTHFDAATALADACRAPYERALTLLALAGLHLAKARGAEAIAALDEARALCTPLDATPALACADSLAARLARSPSPPPPYPAGLTAREVEVLRLVAAGQTSRSIADRLFISAVTVNNHIAHVLTKTRTANRAEAAAFAQRHGLV